jgi:hypothetical protein
MTHIARMKLKVMAGQTKQGLRLLINSPKIKPRLCLADV